MALIGTISGSVGAGNSLTSNNAVTGTLVIANITTSFPTIAADTILFVSGVIGGTSKVVVGGDLVTSGSSSFFSDVSVSGKANLSTVTERLLNSNGSTGIVSFDFLSQGIFYVNGPAGDITANFTNVPTTTNRVITPTVILSQSSTARIISGCQIDGTWQTINWSNGVTPTGTANKQEIYGFSLIRSGTGGSAVWKVLAQMSTYG